MFPRPDHIPDAPGSYQFKDEDGRIIYVGKAKSLRSRLSSYFVRPALLHPRTAQMMERAASVEWIQVESDVEAIMLEYNLIKIHRPHFNVRLIDDKTYPWLAVTVDERYPRAMITRGVRRKGTRYFGPYAQSYALRETLDLLLRTFPLRTCNDAKYVRHERLGRPCLLFHIERCSGPCVGEISPEDYQILVNGIMAFMDGDTKAISERLEAAMHEASEEQNYEEAASYRDKLESIQIAGQRQEMVASVDEDLDIIGVAHDELEAAVQVLYVRHGRVVGRDGFILEKVEPMTAEQLSGRVLETNYGETPLRIAGEILVDVLPDECSTYADWLSERRGRRVNIHAPKRGRRRHLLDTAISNAKEELLRHRTRRAGDLTSRAQALEQLKHYLGLKMSPLRIECYDMSHLQGTNYVGSMVVMEDGLLKRPDYRRFKVNSVGGNDDYAAMREVLLRRLRRIDEDANSAGGGRPARFSYPPQLLLLDGGKGQLGVGIDVVRELGLDGQLELAALAKQFEEVYVPGRPDPIRIPRDSDAIYLLQQIRDEAHRFAISFHRELRNRRMTKGALDDVSGLGPKRRRRILREFGTVRAIRAASRDELRAIDWLPDPVASALYDHLHSSDNERRGA
ncbi:MAG TPA: excinuclease ABC subunit UvrC [Acidimicrobiales bacterium]|nr:excinuclease ABC subunit UvrC [Acidimicrobiales bacterium]